MRLFRSSLSVVALAALAGTSLAQGDELQAKYEKKIAKPFVAAGGWVLDYDQAREQAKAEDKLIFIYFTRSYSP